MNVSFFRRQFYNNLLCLSLESCQETIISWFKSRTFFHLILVFFHFIHTLIFFTPLGTLSTILNACPSNIAIIDVMFIFE